MFGFWRGPVRGAVNPPMVFLLRPGLNRNVTIWAGVT